MKKTFYVIGPGYFGRSTDTLIEAARRCHEAGCGRTVRVIVILVVGDDNARFVPPFFIDRIDTAETIDLGAFKLGALLSSSPS